MPEERPAHARRYGGGVGPIYERPDKPKRLLVEYVMIGAVVLLLIVGALAAYAYFAPSFKEVPNTVAEGFQNDRINILLIGVGGDAHPGAGKDLADAIMVLSLKPSTKQAALISIPRDLYLRVGRFGIHRLNAAHSLGDNGGYPGRGPGLLIDTVAKVIGQPLHAFIRIDFAAFVKIINELGGVDVYVYRGFHDYLFNDEFKPGWQRMDGQRALRYARLRYIYSEEGTNFARELRQQQVIAAIRDRIANLSAKDAMRLAGVARAVSSHTTTNLTAGQMIELYSMFHDIDRKKIRHVSLRPYTEIFMVRNPLDPGEAVRPKTGDYGQIHQMARTVFSDTKPIVAADAIQLTDVGAPPAKIPVSARPVQPKAAPGRGPGS